MKLDKADTSINGFTLIELSIVLVIIGLIVGGVLVGRDLISAAGVRAQVTQIEKYNQAVNAFKGKYGYLPGDIPDPGASSFGFKQRGAYAGQGDGNGVLEGTSINTPNSDCANFLSGEIALFWVDLSQANLIDGSFTAASATSTPASLAATQIASYLPAAKISGNFIYPWGDACYGWPSAALGTAENYFTIAGASGTDSSHHILGTVNLTVQQAYKIDQKIDDGLPQSGNAKAFLWIKSGGNGLTWAGTSTVGNGLSANTTATPGSSTTCFDNNNVAGTQNYSITQSNGSYVNCALSIKFQ